MLDPVEINQLTLGEWDRPSNHFSNENNREGKQISKENKAEIMQLLEGYAKKRLTYDEAIKKVLESGLSTCIDGFTKMSRATIKDMYYRTKKSSGVCQAKGEKYNFFVDMYSKGHPKAAVMELTDITEREFTYFYSCYIKQFGTNRKKNLQITKNAL